MHVLCSLIAKRGSSTVGSDSRRVSFADRAHVFLDDVKHKMSHLFHTDSKR
jgi:hypothetical protein